MDFTFNEEQQMLRDTARDFVNAEVKPLAAQIDKDKKIPQSLLDQIRDLGFLGVPFPEEYGGGGFGEIGLCIFMEEITRGCFSTAVVCGGHTSIGAQAIYLAGTEEQKQRYLPDLCEGKKWAAYALTEADSGSDAGAMAMTATPEGDDWILEGNTSPTESGRPHGQWRVLRDCDVGPAVPRHCRPALRLPGKQRICRRPLQSRPTPLGHPRQATHDRDPAPIARPLESTTKSDRNGTGREVWRCADRRGRIRHPSEPSQSVSGIDNLLQNDRCRCVAQN